MARIAFNLAFIDVGPLTGPGYYAVQLFEHVLRLPQHGPVCEIVAYVQKDAIDHFSHAAQMHIVVLPNFSGRLTRVFYEHVVLPFSTASAGTDILFSPAFVSPIWGGRKLVATICDMYYRVIPEMTEPFQRKYWKIMIPVTAYRCDRVITISSNSKADIEKYIPAARGKTVSIPLASRFAVSDNVGQPKNHRSFVLMVANLTPNKNCAVAVQAIAMLRDKGLDISFVHAGKDHLALLQQSIAEYGAEELYQSCLAVVVPSLYEGFGMPAVEAQAMGAPLICSDRAALPEAAGDGALYFDPEDADALAGRIEAMLVLSETERQNIIDSGFENVRQFSWQKTAHDTMVVFKELLAQR